ncbi:hypothetical protein BDN70DRAFT_900940 [Pholiota conissans]|uniref:Uncharacterized protein n=1 Tax=Pholiota conissans TaxID=109636 RepID=A0A9P5YNP6_9AGAR|nr:hypothetical protein BDN70DRAFT_900940 [Pholiota conissans]
MTNNTTTQQPPDSRADALPPIGKLKVISLHLGGSGKCVTQRFATNWLSAGRVTIPWETRKTILFPRIPGTYRGKAKSESMTHPSGMVARDWQWQRRLMVRDDDKGSAPTTSKMVKGYVAGVRKPLRIQMRKAEGGQWQG